MPAYECKIRIYMYMQALFITCQTVVISSNLTNCEIFVDCSFTAVQLTVLLKLQLNTTGLSNAKQLLLNRSLKDQKLDFVALNETKKQVPENFLTNYWTLSRCRGQNQRGVSLSVPKDTSCCGIQDLKNEKFDSNWCAVHYRKQSILVTTA